MVRIRRAGYVVLVACWSGKILQSIIHRLQLFSYQTQVCLSPISHFLPPSVWREVKSHQICCCACCYWCCRCCCCMMLQTPVGSVLLFYWTSDITFFRPNSIDLVNMTYRRYGTDSVLVLLCHRFFRFFWNRPNQSLVCFFTELGPIDIRQRGNNKTTQRI